MHVSVASGTALSFFSVCNPSPPPSLQLHSVVCHLWHPQVLQGFGEDRNCESHNVTSPSVTRVTHLLEEVSCQSHNFASTFYLDEWHAFCEVWVTQPNIAFTYSAPWSTYGFVPALKLSGDSCEARFSLEKETTSGRGWQHHMWIHTDLVNPRRLRKHNESEPEECGRIPAAHVFFEKKRLWERSAASHLIFSVTLNARRVLLEKTHGIWKGFCDARFS